MCNYAKDIAEHALQITNCDGNVEFENEQSAGNSRLVFELVAGRWMTGYIKWKSLVRG